MAGEDRASFFGMLDDLVISAFLFRRERTLDALHAGLEDTLSSGDPTGRGGLYDQFGPDY